jgi:hypothetical protein
LDRVAKADLIPGWYDDFADEYEGRILAENEKCESETARESLYDCALMLVWLWGLIADV